MIVGIAILVVYGAVVAAFLTHILVDVWEGQERELRRLREQREWRERMERGR